MRRIICEKCTQKHLPAGTREIYARSEYGEPAEIQRLTLGKAKTPEASQRWVSINGVREALSTEYFNCDNCGAEIKPGESCAAWTVWIEDSAVVPEWEHEFLEREVGHDDIEAQ